MADSNFYADVLHRVFHGDAWHGAAVMENLEGVDARAAAAHPIAGAHSVWELVLHLASWNREFAKLLRGGKVSLEMNTPQDWPPVKETSEAAWKQVLLELRDSEEEIEREVKRARDFASKVPGREYTVEFLLACLPHHLVYHGGQIALLRKALRRD